MSEFQFCIDVAVRNEWENVERLRMTVQSCFLAVFSSVDGSHALSMITGELLENAIKHGHWAQGGGRFRLRVWGDRTMGSVTVENPVSSLDKAQTVVALVTELNSYPTAADAYQARLIECAAAPRGGDRSGLGLARILYEGGCRLTCDVEGDVLRVTAQLPFSDHAS